MPDQEFFAPLGDQKITRFLGVIFIKNYPKNAAKNEVKMPHF